MSNVRRGDGITRPIVYARVQAADGSLERDRFLIDSGADRTVLSADLLIRLALPPAPNRHGEGGERRGFSATWHAWRTTTSRLRRDARQAEPFHHGGAIRWGTSPF